MKSLFVLNIAFCFMIRHWWMCWWISSLVSWWCHLYQHWWFI